MLEHQAPAVDRLVILAPAPVGVELVVLTTAAALLDVEVISLVIRVDGTAAPVAPDDGQVGAVRLGMEGQGFVSPPPTRPNSADRPAEANR